MVLTHMRLLLICLGGALGTAARYGMQSASARWLGDFPFGTLGVNLLGSFAISFVFIFSLNGQLSDTARLALGTGILGGFTTYSSFNLETLRLLDAGAFDKAFIYLSVTLIGCLLCGFAGLLLARMITAAS